MTVNTFTHPILSAWMGTDAPLVIVADEAGKPEFGFATLPGTSVPQFFDIDDTMEELLRSVGWRPRSEGDNIEVSNLVEQMRSTSITMAVEQLRNMGVAIPTETTTPPTTQTSTEGSTPVDSKRPLDSKFSMSFPTVRLEFLQKMEEDKQTQFPDKEEQEIKRMVLQEIVEDGTYMDEKKIKLHYWHQGIFLPGTNLPSIGFCPNGEEDGEWATEDEEAITVWKAIEEIYFRTYKPSPPFLKPHHVTEAIVGLTKDVVDVRKKLKKQKKLNDDMQKRISELEKKVNGDS